MFKIWQQSTVKMLNCFAFVFMLVSISGAQERTLTQLNTDDFIVLTGRQGFEKFEQQLGSYFSDIALSAFRQRQSRIDSVKTRDDFANYRKETLAHFFKGIGPFPARTSLNVKHYGQLDCGDYIIDKLTFESRPGYLVNANLYIPQNHQPPFPLVLCPTGHWWGGRSKLDGKGYHLVQERCVGLARRGYYVLAFDPFGQGERKILFEPDTELQSKLGQATHQHITLNLQLHLTGHNLTNFFIWDCIRGIDVLCSLENADTSRIAVTGASGGGSQTQYVSAADPRVKASIPVCANWFYGTESHDGKGNLDGEQNIPGRIRYGIEMSDLLLMNNVRDILLMNASGDTQILLGSVAMYNDINSLFNRIYADQPERSVTYHLIGSRHSYNRDFRETMYNWLNQKFNRSEKGCVEEPITIRSAEDINITKSGSVEELDSKDLLTMNQEFVRDIAPSKPVLKNEADLAVFRKKLVQKIHSILKMVEVPQMVSSKIRETIQGIDFTLEKIVFRSEDSIWIPGLLFTPINLPQDKSSASSVVLYIHERGKVNGMENIFHLVRAGMRVFAVDTRGFKEAPDPHPGLTPRDNGPEFKGYKIIYDKNDDEADFNAFGYELEKPLFGMRLLDVMAAIQYLKSRPDVNTDNITIYGYGDGAMLALHAAILDDQIKNIVLNRLVLSFKELAGKPYGAQSPFLFIHNVVAHYDVPELIAALAPHRVIIVNTVGSRRQILEESIVRQTYDVSRNIFKGLGFQQNLKISRLSDKQVAHLLAE